MTGKARAVAWVVIVVIVTLMTGVAACGSAPGPAASPTTSETPGATESTTTSPSAEPTGALDGQALVQERCTTCHTLDRVAAEDGDAARWGAIVDQMIGKGAKVNDQEKQVVIDYLAATYPDQ